MIDTLFETHFNERTTSTTSPYTIKMRNNNPQNVSNQFVNSKSAPDSRDFGNASAYQQRSTSEYSLPSVYHPPEFISQWPNAPRRLQQHQQQPEIQLRPVFKPHSSVSMFSSDEFLKEPESKICYSIRLEPVDAIESLQIALAEFLGTAILLMVGCAPFPFVMPWSFAFAITAAVQAFGPISGAHINPAVTIAAFIMGKIKNPLLVPVYLLCQYAGALVGYTTHFYVVLSSFEDKQGMCVTKPPDGIDDWQVFVLEMIMTWILCTAVCALWDPKNGHTSDTASLKLGLIVAGIILAMTDVVPISLNSARSLPPSLLNDDWSSHWIYVVAPNVGGLLAGLIYRFLLFPRHYVETPE